jgi:hypothetical protein
MSEYLKQQKELIFDPILLWLNQYTETRVYGLFTLLVLGALFILHFVYISEKSSPWQNGFQESFYVKFKHEMGLHRIQSCNSYMETYNLIAQRIEYYCTQTDSRYRSFRISGEWEDYFT